MTLGSLPASESNFLAETAQVDVSRLVTMFNMMVLPAQSRRRRSERLPSTRTKSGGTEPTAGREPEVEVGEPFTMI
ncbi:MAG: hypothetical protein A2413_12200 [Treponema sp. RIFOXYC1_FULL_61_9]|nr:MAG: hypothetical protein A2413_12200 [Treponema sp. RIFOXYC1_FULL_61_9]